MQKIYNEKFEMVPIEMLEPCIIEKKDIFDFKIGKTESLPFPLIGSYRPQGWRFIRSYCVDKTDFPEGETYTITIPSFLDSLKPGRGYAVIDENPLQLHIGEFSPLIM